MHTIGLLLLGGFLIFLGMLAMLAIQSAWQIYKEATAVIVKKALKEHTNTVERTSR